MSGRSLETCRVARPAPVARWTRLALALGLAAGLAGCSGDKAEPQAQPARRPAAPVSVATVEQKTMPVQIQAIGSVEALSVVSVRAQVGGELMRVHFKEGQEVKKGELLFSIDARPLEAALAQAEANLAKDVVQIQQARAVLERDRARISQTRAALARDQTQASNADVQANRYADLLKRGLVAQEQYDGFRTTADALGATLRADEADVKSAEETVRADEAAVRSAEQTVKADEAAVQNARLQLSYAQIRAPIDGRTGSLVLHEGNIVRAGGTTDSTLVVINQIQPVYVTFTVPQQQLPAIKRYMAEGKLAVEAVAQGDPRPLRGVVTFIDNAVDPTTGTIKLKATFANEEKRLWPGQFVNVSLTLAVESDVVVVPSGAVQTGQQGPYAFVVKPDATVEARPVVVARTQGSESVIKKGLEPGESVVVDGQTRLAPGAKVEVRAKGARPGAADAGGPQKGGGAGPRESAESGKAGSGDKATARDAAGGPGEKAAGSDRKGGGEPAPAATAKDAAGDGASRAQRGGAAAPVRP